MKFLDRFKGEKNPTMGWVPDPALEIVFDFNAQALCGVKIGNEVEGLSKLGPAQDTRAACRGLYCYYSRGFAIGVENNLVRTYTLVWTDYLRQGYKVFAGTCRYQGKGLELSPATTENQITSLFGEPYWRDRDEDEIILFYEHGPVEWQVELDSVGNLKEILVVTPPLMAEEDQRKAFGVTKPWPA